MPGPNKETSQLRQDMHMMIAHMESLLKEVMRREEIAKGSVYQHRRKCGRKRCRCMQGRLHERTAFSFSDKGRTAHIALTKVNEERIRRGVDYYQRFRSARAELRKTWSKLNNRMDQMECIRRIQPADLYEKCTSERA